MYRMRLFLIALVLFAFTCIFVLSGCNAASLPGVPTVQPTYTQSTPARVQRYVGLVTSVAFSADGQTLAAGYQSVLADENPVRLWNVAKPYDAPTVLRSHESGVDAVVFSPDGKVLASGGVDGRVRLWNVDELTAPPTVLTGTTISGYAIPYSPIRALAFSPNGTLLAAGGGEDRAVRLWNLDNLGEGPKTLAGGYYSGTSLSFSPDGSKLAAAEHPTIRVWDMNNLDSIPTELNPNAGAVWAVTFSPDGRTLASGGVDKKIRLWDMSRVKPILTQPELTGHTNTVLSLAFSPDGHMLASSSTDGTVRLWDLKQPQVDSTILRGHTGRVTSISFSPNGQRLASAGGDGTIRLWDVSQPGAAPVVLTIP